jgi:thymidylate kinase
MMVVILGPDGSGKSTVINQLETILAGTFQKISVSHLRPPAFGGIQKGKQAPKDPHTQKPYSPLLSTAKVLYLFMLYQISYWSNLLAIKSSQHLLLIDRYWIDLFVDPLRFRVSHNGWVIQLLTHLVPMPDIIFLLDAPSEVIYTRKQELSLEELERQRRIFKQLVGASTAGHIINAHCATGAIVKEMKSIVLDKRKQRFKTYCGSS